MEPLASPAPGAVGGTITFELFVQGQIVPSQGDYIIAVNANTDRNTDVNPNETPGEPTAQEAQLGTYTHWDQAFVYGFDTQVRAGGFAYQYKAINTGGRGSAVQFVPIILNANDYTFIASGSNGSGTNNALMITLPIADFSIRGNPNGSNPPTITTPAVVALYVNYITLDTTRTPQDQLGCCGTSTTGFALIVDLCHANTYLSQLTSPPSKTGPSNPSLFITGGEIIVAPRAPLPSNCPP